MGSFSKSGGFDRHGKLSLRSCWQGQSGHSKAKGEHIDNLHLDLRNVIVGVSQRSVMITSHTCYVQSFITELEQKP